MFILTDTGTVFNIGMFDALFVKEGQLTAARLTPDGKYVIQVIQDGLSEEEGKDLMTSLIKAIDSKFSIYNLPVMLDIIRGRIADMLAEQQYHAEVARRLRDGAYDEEAG